MYSPGISKEQAHRVMEDLQQNAQSLNSFKNKAKLLKTLGKQHHLPVLDVVGEGIENDVGIMKEHLDALHRDIQGMMNGNMKNNQKKEE